MSENINIPEEIKKAKENIKEGIEKIRPGIKNNSNLLEKKQKYKNAEGKLKSIGINEKLQNKRENYNKAINEQNIQNRYNEYQTLRKEKKIINNLLKETNINSPFVDIKKYLVFLFNPVYYQSRTKNLITFLIFLGIFGLNIYLFIKSLLSSEENLNYDIFFLIIIYLVIYLFFIHCMNIKRVCGKNTSFIEFFYPKNLKFTLLKLLPSSITNIKEYETLIQEHSCFPKPEKNFKINNVKKIKNLNTDFNKTAKGMRDLMDYPNNIPNNKYIFLTIYLILVVTLFINCLIDSDKKTDGKKEQIINSIIICMILFIWTCVLDLPLWIIIALFVIIAICFLIFSSISFYGQVGEKGTDDEFRCKPYIIPFVNKSWAGISFSDNLNNCIANKSNSLFLNMMKPYLNAIHEIEEQIAGQNNKINSLSNLTNVFQEKLNSLSNQILEKINHIFDKIGKIKDKIYEIIANIFLIFKSIIWAIMNMLYAIKSIDNILNDIPIICFDENTIINMNNGKTKYIKDIKVGDSLEDNNEIIGIIKSKYTNQELYLYNNIIVTGNHYVYDLDGLHKPISESKDSNKIENYSKPYLYCLITLNQKIKINNIYFSDYFDIDNIKIQYDIQNIILSKLNNFDIISNESDNENIPLWCFDKDTKIKMVDNKKQKIKEIKIGDDTYYGKVYSIQKIKVNKDNIYKINDVITTGEQIIKLSNKWIKVKDYKHSKKIDVIDNIFYNISTEQNKLSINNMTFTDFEQYPNYGYYEYQLDKSLE